MVLNRKQFRKYFNNLCPGCGDDDGILWVPEERNGKKSRWFICIRPINFIEKSNKKRFKKPTKEDFFVWCAKNCSGEIKCYSSSDTEEWWGFSHKADILLWKLRWG